MKLSDGLRGLGLCLLLLLSGCRGSVVGSPAQDPLERAAAEATAIVQAARATALIREARAQATALAVGAVATPATERLLPSSTAPSPQPSAAAASLAITPPAEPSVKATALPEPAPTVTRTISVKVISVGLAAEGGFVMVNYIAPPEVATRWYQGAVWVENEVNGERYAEVGVMPVVGPLFGRPVEPGQPGYVMLVNGPVPLARGAVVTVVLGDYRFEHLSIEQP